MMSYSSPLETPSARSNIEDDNVFRGDDLQIFCVDDFRRHMIELVGLIQVWLRR